MPENRELPWETVVQALWASCFILPMHVRAPVAASGLSALQALEPGKGVSAAAIPGPFNGCNCCCCPHRNGLAIAVRRMEGVQTHQILCLFYICFQP